MSNNKICPECGNAYNERPAISRVDNVTEICPSCGMRQALESMCVFEKIPCKYACKIGIGFICQAPSDDEMLCKKEIKNEQK